MKCVFILFLFLSGVATVFPQAIINSNPTFNDRFSKRAGSLRFSETTLKIGKIRTNELKRDTVRIYNDGSQVLSLSTGKVPPHLFVQLGTASLAPKAESWIAVQYDASLKNDYGFVLDRIEIHTNDAVQPEKMISVTASILEYFPPLSSEDSALVQKAKWPEPTYDYGKIKPGEKVTHNFFVTNEGKMALYIRKTKSSCSCLKASVSSDTIAPGVAGYITVEFDSGSREGKDSRKLRVYLNDPAQPEVVLELKGEIGK